VIREVLISIMNRRKRKRRSGKGKREDEQEHWGGEDKQR
jgi:hypothetical protein